MIAPRSIQQRLADVAPVPVAHAIGWLQTYAGDSIRPVKGEEGRRYTVNSERVLTAEQIVERYRARAAGIAQGVG